MKRQDEHPHPRRYEGDTHASISFRIYAAPDFKGTILAEGNHLMTQEVAEALKAELEHWMPWPS